VPVITPKPALCAVQQVVPGLLKCGVLKASKASTRNLDSMLSRNLTPLERDKSKLTMPDTQNADIFIKYDPRTQTGYSLRWWRTTQSARKCMFQLYQHTRGVGTPVSPTQELTGVFKPNTYMTLSIIGSNREHR